MRSCRSRGGRAGSRCRCRSGGRWRPSLAGGLGVLGLAPALLLVGLDLGLDAALGLEVGRLLGLFLLDLLELLLAPEFLL